MNTDSALHLIDCIQRKAPEYLDLLTATTDDDFERAFEAILNKAVSGLEANSRNFKDLDEVALTGVLRLALSIPGLTVNQEAHSNGHVDLTIISDHSVPERKKLGEAKIYRGPEYHIGGLEQLLSRYTTGREGRGLLIVYVRKPDIAGLVKKLRQRLDAVHPCNQQGMTCDHPNKWSFVSSHVHSSGEVLEVNHVGCNLFAGTFEPSTPSEI